MLQNGCTGIVSGKSSGGALAISNIASANVTATAAGVTWQTNLPATSQVEYGTTTAYGLSTSLDSTMVTSHQQSLSALKAGTLYHYRVHSSDASNNPAASGDLTFTTASSGGDTTPPSVSIASPVNGTTVSGTITVTANATDNVSVASVQFQLDGTNLGSLITVAPYSTSWNTTGASNGAHTLSAIAKDGAGNSATSAGVAVTVNNVTATAPTITAQPTNQTVTAGQTATFTVAATGTVPLSYQWQKNAVSIAGATSASYTTPVTTTADSGATFRVVVSNTAGTVTSSAATLTVSVPDTTPPTVSITAPAASATVSGTISVSANASDNVGVASVQFQLDGVNLGQLDTTAPYSVSWDSTVSGNGSHTLTAIARDLAGNSATSAGITVTVANVVNTAMGPLVPDSTNPSYFVTPSGKRIFLAGSHTWNSFQDLDTSLNPAPVDFNAYVNFLKAHGHNVTILWRKDLPSYCGWGAGGLWTIAQWPWKRSGPGTASDGKPQFDLTQLDQTYFDRLRSRAQTLGNNGIYAIVQLFDGLQLMNNRCTNDGYPFTAGNNVNGVDDGGGSGSITMGAPNTITGFQDAYVKKVIDTLNDLPNVFWEVSEESPGNSGWWQGHMIGLIKAYEAGGTWEGTTYASKPAQHPVGLGEFNTSDGTLYNTNALWVAPYATFPGSGGCGSGAPQCKVIINDSDHSYFGMWNFSAQANRQFLWENFTNGVGGVIFMDPYIVFWSASNRNLCTSPVNGVCSAPDSRWDNFRNNMGYMLNYANNKLDLLKTTPQGGLSSTGFCLADTVASGAEYLVYAPNGGSFTVNLSATTRTLNVEWLNPSTGAITTGGTISGGSASQSFTPPFSGDAVLYLVDVAGHN